MRAAVIRSFGDPSAIELASVPLPTPGPGQVLIRVAAAAVNPVDIATRAGALAHLMAPQDVIGLGWDVAGTVAVGAEFPPGTEVIGISDRLNVPLGTHADFVVLDASAVAIAPTGMSLVESATLPLNGLTALQALDLLQVPDGGTVLITGAAGAVGGFAVQLAIARGFHVIGLARPTDADYIRSLGADFAPDLTGLLVDGAIDTADLGIAALNAVRNRGSFIALGPGPTGLRGITVRTVWIDGDGAQLATLVSLIESGKLSLRVAQTLPLEDLPKAHSLIAAGGTRGAVVVSPERPAG
jgi:NADPH:quinone reductase-like Zn-dependent oxidoreductase